MLLRAAGESLRVNGMGESTIATEAESELLEVCRVILSAVAHEHYVSPAIRDGVVEVTGLLQLRRELEDPVEKVTCISEGDPSTGAEVEGVRTPFDELRKMVNDP